MSEFDHIAKRRAQRALNAASQAVSENLRLASRVRENWLQRDQVFPDSPKQEKEKEDALRNE